MRQSWVKCLAYACVDQPPGTVVTPGLSDLGIGGVRERVWFGREKGKSLFGNVDERTCGPRHRWGLDVSEDRENCKHESFALGVGMY